MKKPLIAGLLLLVAVGAGLSFKYLNGESLQGSFPPSSSLSMSLRSSPVSSSAVAGTDDHEFTGLTLDCTISTGCTITDLTLQGFLDDEGDNNDWDTSYDSADHSSHLSDAVASVWLVDDSGAVVSDVESVSSSSYQVLFGGLNLTMANGDSMDLIVVGDISSNVYWGGDAEGIAFGVNASTDLVAEDGDGNSVVPSGTVNAGTPVVYTSTLPNGSLTASVDSSTPAAATVTNGTADQLASIFRFNSTNEAFLITKLSINNSQTGVRLANLGDNDNNVHTITLEYEDEDGTIQTDSAALVSGTAQFSGLTMFVPADDSALLSVNVDINSTADGATVGEKIKLNLAFNNFTALGITSGATLNGAALDASVASTADLDFGRITYKAGSGIFAIDGAQNLSSKTPGSSASLTIDNDAGDNANKLPAGAIICMDDNNNGICALEDIYIVTSWPSTKAGTEDIVSVIMIDDAGDGTYDAHDDVLYALPGTGFLSGVKAITVN